MHESDKKLLEESVVTGHGDGTVIIEDKRLKDKNTTQPKEITNGRSNSEKPSELAG